MSFGAKHKACDTRKGLKAHLSRRPRERGDRKTDARSASVSSSNNDNYEPRNEAVIAMAVDRRGEPDAAAQLAVGPLMV